MVKYWVFIQDSFKDTIQRAIWGEWYINLRVASRVNLAPGDYAIVYQTKDSPQAVAQCFVASLRIASYIYLPEESDQDWSDFEIKDFNLWKKPVPLESVVGGKIPPLGDPKFARGAVFEIDERDFERVIKNTAS